MRAIFVAVVAALFLIPTAAQAQTVADWEMNEGRNANVMHDETGDHNAWIRKRVHPDGKHFEFIGRKTIQTYDPKRVIVVPDSDELDPGDSNYTVSIRFKAYKQFDPNIVQKGQTKQTGGFWKITLLHGHHPRCLFRDETGKTRATGFRDLDLADRKWTTLRCSSTETTTRLVVIHGGVKHVAVNDHVGRIGTINNARPLVIGGKLDCQAEGVGCDYFKGLVDYVRVSKS